MRISRVLPIGGILLAAACSSDPTGPGDGGGGGASEWAVSLSVSSIVVREMCDGFPVDANGGEWSHKLTARFPGETSKTLGSTSSYPSASSKKNAGRGASLALTSSARIQNRTLTSKEGDTITLTIQATEWDYDILGNNPFADSRMNDRSATKTFEFKDGAWPNVSDGKLTLSNTSSCILDVNYSFEAVKK